MRRGEDGHQGRDNDKSQGDVASEGRRDQETMSTSQEWREARAEAIAEAKAKGSIEECDDAEDARRHKGQGKARHNSTLQRGRDGRTATAEQASNYD
jgi:hypothetical protein